MNKDITYHYESTTTLQLDMDPEELKTPQAAFITETNNRGFRIKTALLYGGIHLILLFWTFYYLHDKHGKHENIKKWYRNYDYVGCGYDIAVTSILLLCLAILSFWYKVAKSVVGYGLVTLILVAYVYLIGFILRIACKSSNDLDEEITKAFVALWCGGFGMLIATCLPTPSHRKDFGMAIGSGMYLVMLILWRFVYCLDNPQIWVTALYVVGFGVYSWYINECLYIMVTKRVHIYTSKDWAIAFGHLQTDIFAMFWIDLFRKKKPVIIDEQVMENDFDVRVTTRGDEPGKDELHVKA